MESVDGARSLKVSSDECFAYECSPCRESDVTKEAKFYCPQCSDYLCASCEDSHKRFGRTRNHTVLSGKNLPPKPASAGRPAVKSTILCSCGAKEVSIYCTSHDDVICIGCKTLKHRACPSCSIQEKSKDFNVHTADSKLSNANELTTILKQLQNSAKRSLEHISSQTKTCREAIKNFSALLKAEIQKMEDKSLEDLKKVATSLTSSIHEEIDISNIALDKLNSDMKSLQSSKDPSNQQSMFIWNLRLSKTLREIESVTRHMRKDACKPWILFDANEKILTTESDSLGSVKCEQHPETRKVIANMSIKSIEKVDVRLPRDTQITRITGSVFMATGELVLCDSDNKCLKVFDKTLTQKRVIELSGDPWDITAVTRTDVVFTLPMKKKLQYGQVLPDLQVGRSVELDKKCWGIEACRDDMYVSCHNYPGEGEVRIYGSKGQLKKRIGVSQDGTYQFQRPYYIAVSMRDELYVSDWNLHKNFRLSKDGSQDVTLGLSDHNLLRPCGVLLDGDDNVFVCGEDSNNVIVFDKHGKKIKTLLTASDGLKYPLSISYRQSDNTLVVGGNGSTTIVVVKLE